ncbi:hypothetical protein BH23CHL2_BH23CHL2_09980 [soil metagenome]
MREFVREKMTPLVDEITVDPLGNLIGVRRGQGGPRVMIAAHMDEIGFMVKHIDDKGFLRLQATGGFDVTRLPAQRVIVHASSGEQFRGPLDVAGKPLHMIPPDEQKPPMVEDLFVDIGLSAEQAGDLVEIGDMVTLYRERETIGGHNLKPMRSRSPSLTPVVCSAVRLTVRQCHTQPVPRQHQGKAMPQSGHPATSRRRRAGASRSRSGPRRSGWRAGLP